MTTHVSRCGATMPGPGLEPGRGCPQGILSLVGYLAHAASIGTNRCHSTTYAESRPGAFTRWCAVLRGVRGYIRGTIAVSLFAFVSACDWQALSPGDKCWWQRSNPAVVTDTIWNTTPDTGDPSWRPYLLVGRQVWTDSARVCR